MQGIGGVDRRGTALDVVHLCAFIGDDQRALELTHVLRVDPEVGLQRDVDLDARRDIDERAARPDRRVKRGELVVVRWDHRREVFLHEVGILAQRLVRAEEEHALLFEVLTDVVVYDLGVVLRTHAGEQALLLSLRNTELVVGVLDVVGDIFPIGFVAIGRADVVVDVVEVDIAQLAAPLGHRSSVEVVERLESELAHPLRLVLDIGDSCSRPRARGPWAA